uniref:Uncharacterized protein n=1 Tax=Aegilops tauschii TaxID=37682 RepID=M8BVG9_AEGTA
MTSTIAIATTTTTTAATATTTSSSTTTAGWLHEEAGRKLVVDCAEKGVVFMEADVDIAVAKLSNTRCPPLLFFEEFIGDDNVYRASPLGVLLAAVADKPLVSVVRQTSHCISDVPTN